MSSITSPWQLRVTCSWATSQKTAESGFEPKPLRPRHQLFPLYHATPSVPLQISVYLKVEKTKERQRKALVLMVWGLGWAGGRGFRRVGKGDACGKMSQTSSLCPLCPGALVAVYFCLVGQSRMCPPADFPGPHGTGPIFSSALMGHVCPVLPNHKNNHTLVAGRLGLAHRPHRAAWACSQPPPRCCFHLA